MIRIITALCAAVMALTPFAAAAEDRVPNWLFVQTASGFTSDGNNLTIPYEREIFGFTDRPNRMHAYLNATEFASLWGIGYDDFTENPPNAVLTWVADDKVQEAELKLTAIALNDHGRTITYTATFEAGTALPKSASAISLFIDSAQRVTATFLTLSQELQSAEGN